MEYVKNVICKTGKWLLGVSLICIPFGLNHTFSFQSCLLKINTYAYQCFTVIRTLMQMEIML